MKYHRTHRNEKPVVTSGADHRVLQITDAHFYSDSPAAEYNYPLLADKIYCSRFPNVSRLKLEQWIDEAERGNDVTLVAGPSPGIANVKEILTATNEQSLMHPVVAMSNPESSTDQFAQHTYTVSFEPVSQCGF